MEELRAELLRRRDVLVPLVNKCHGLKAHVPPSTFYLYVNATKALRLCGCDTVDAFRRLVMDETGVSFCHREHFGRAQPGEEQAYIRLAYSNVTVDEIKVGMQKLRDFLKSKVPEDDSSSSSSE